MGREATCLYRYGTETAVCKVQLEAGEILLKAPIRKRIPVCSISGLSVHGDEVSFLAGGDEVVLSPAHPERPCGRRPL